MNNSKTIFDQPLAIRSQQHLTDHSVLFVLGCIFGFWILAAVVMIFQEDGYPFLNLNLFPLTLFGGGLVCTVFYQVKKQTTPDYLSNLTIRSKDDFLNKWFISALIYPTVITLLFWSYSIFADELYFHFSLEQISTFNPVEGWSIPYIEVYLIAQFVFLISVVALRQVPFLMKSIGRILESSLSILLGVLAIRRLLIDCVKNMLLHLLVKQNE